MWRDSGVVVGWHPPYGLQGSTVAGDTVRVVLVGRTHGRPSPTASLLEIPAGTPYLTGNPIRERVMAFTNPLQFLQQVRAEVAKVVWPTRREVLLTTLMVFILSALAATFFSLVDLADPHRPAGDHRRLSRGPVPS